MSDPFDDDDLAASRAIVPDVRSGEFASALAALQPRIDELAARWSAGRIHFEDPQDRAEGVELRQRLTDLIDHLNAVRDIIDNVFLRAAVNRHAEVIPLPDGRQVRYEPARGEYVGDMRRLRARLMELAVTGKGDLTREEIDEALREEVVVKPNHTKLNTLRKRLGGPVAEVIDAERAYVAPAPERGRVRFPPA